MSERGRGGAWSEGGSCKLQKGQCVLELGERRGSAASVHAECGAAAS